MFFRNSLVSDLALHLLFVLCVNFGRGSRTLPAPLRRSRAA